MPSWMRPLLGPALVVVNAVIAACWPVFDPTYCNRTEYVLITCAIGALAIFLMGWAYKKQDDQSQADRLVWLRTYENTVALREDTKQVQAAAEHSLKARAYILAIKIRAFLEQRYLEQGALTVEGGRPGRQVSKTMANFTQEITDDYLKVRKELNEKFPGSTDLLFKEKYALPKYDEDFFQISGALERLAAKLP